MLRKSHWWTEPQPLFGHAQPDLASDVIVYDDFEGTSGDDVIKGTEGDDTINGLAGNDMLKGQGGDDVIHGGDGNDQVFGGDGDDTLYGDGGYNEIRGGEGNDHIFGGSSIDNIYGGIGENIIDSTKTSYVYTMTGGIDHILTASFWTVDYSDSTEGVDITNGGLTFSNGTSAQKITSYNFMLGSGNDSFAIDWVGKPGQRVDAGGGVDSFDFTSTYTYPMSLTRSVDGEAVLTILDGRGHYTNGVFTGFENFHITSGGSGRFTVDGSLLYNGVHLDVDISAYYVLDFSTYDGVVSAILDGDTMNINGSVLKGGYVFTITMGGAGGTATASGYLTGGEGIDTLTGLSADDYINGNLGDDILDGGAGSDNLDGGDGNDTILGSAGVDRIYGRAGDDTIDGGDDDDTIDGGEGNNTLYGGAGDDTIVAGTGRDVMDGGDGDDILTGNDGDDKLIGSAGNDQLYGGAGHNTLNGGDGNDYLLSMAGAIDTVIGGAGKDSWSGDDRAVTQTLTVLFDKAGLHVSDGIEVSKVETIGFTLGTGDDYLTVSAESTGVLGINGNSGVDTIDYSAIKGAITLDLAATGQQDTGGGGIEGIYGFENVIGSAKGDTLTGTAGANQMTGGKGADTLTGGGGADTFIITALTDLGKSDDIDKIDRITDFSHTEGDKVDLSAIDADKKTDGDQAFVFVGANAFTIGGTGPGELRYSQSVDGYLLVQGDINHDGKADFSMLVHNTALVASDFVL